MSKEHHVGPFMSVSVFCIFPRCLAICITWESLLCNGGNLLLLLILLLILSFFLLLLFLGLVCVGLDTHLPLSAQVRSPRPGGSALPHVNAHSSYSKQDYLTPGLHCQGPSPTCSLHLGLAHSDCYSRGFASWATPFLSWTPGLDISMLPPS
jgi:hypothetical protein